LRGEALKRFSSIFVVGAIVALTTVLAFAFQEDADKIKKDQAITLYNIKQLSMAMLMYCADDDDMSIPYKQPKRWKEVIYPYVKSKEMFWTLNPAGGEIKINPCTCGVSTVSIPQPEATPVFYESLVWSDGKRAVSFWDGHAKFLDKTDWEKTKKRLQLKRKDFK
jgi:hypothetical protein